MRITTGGGLLRTDAGALALVRRGACGLPPLELPVPSWGGHQDEKAGRRSPECRQTPIHGTGKGPRAEGGGLRAEGSELRAGGALGKRGAVGLGFGIACRDGENDSFAVGASLLGFIELGP